ncbi:MAG TPA: NAD(P)H-dependent oxidoreductase subunit E [Thermodesulfovibrionales bacterium]|nr:NAD(P)H-dependent oxidoreductase subunit E [Thermodesulfovibrionales bacterium]
MADDLKVLVVDDEPIVTRSAERVLDGEGYIVECARNGREAMLMTEQSHYDLLFTDLRMPEMDGVSLVRAMRQTQPSTGIVVITGYPSQESIEETLDLGIIDYVMKPFTPETLKDVAHRATEWLRKEAADEESKGDCSAFALAELDKVIAQYRGKPGSTIPVLQKAQEIMGYLSPEVQKRIARGLNLFPSEIHSIVSFYSFFTMKPRGEHTIRVCLGTACYVKGIEPVLNRIRERLNIDVGDTTADGLFTLEAVRCVGACGLAPVMVVDQDTHGALTQEKAVKAINRYSPLSTQVPADWGETSFEKEV